MIKRAIINVFGLVVGVNFRYDTKRKAEELNLSGWVKNEPDGSVKIVVEGDEAAIEKIIEWVKTGPDFARVDHISVHWEEAKGEKGFEIKY